MISEQMYVAMAMASPQTICAICQIKFCLRCAAAFTHIMTKNTYCNILPQRILLQNNFIKKHRKSAKKTDSQKTVRMGFYYAANPRASQPSKHTFIIA